MDNIELSLKLTVAETNLILQALGELPLKLGVDVFQKIKDQAAPQLASAVPAPVEPEQPIQ